MYAILLTCSIDAESIVGPYPTYELALNAGISMLKDANDNGDYDEVAAIQTLTDENTVNCVLGNEDFTLSIFPIESPFGRHTVSLTNKEAKAMDAIAEIFNDQWQSAPEIYEGLDDDEMAALISKFTQA